MPKEDKDLKKSSRPLKVELILPRHVVEFIKKAKPKKLIIRFGKKKIKSQIDPSFIMILLTLLFMVSYLCFHYHYIG
jgi:hypothetical protein